MDEKKKTNGKRNKNAGHGFERELCEKFREIGFPHVVTTRSESRSRDAQKIDLINRDEGINGRLPYNVQAKCVTGRVEYERLLSELPRLPNVVNVVIHKFTRRSTTRKTGEKSIFMPVGKYAMLPLEDFLAMAARLQQLEGGKP